KEDSPKGNKDKRAEGWSSQLAAGNVYLVDDGTWDLNAYIEEHVLFKPDPTVVKKRGKYKDQVDASTGAYNIMFGYGKLKELRVFGGKKKQAGLRIIVVSKDELMNLVEEETP